MPHSLSLYPQKLNLVVEVIQRLAVIKLHPERVKFEAMGENQVLRDCKPTLSESIKGSLHNVPTAQSYCFKCHPLLQDTVRDII
ncbi:hypothetical protein HOLleu_20876 [Holothuria leucospilota]|uniref:Uncharacterized protein n=1 Tax=Holothuria leucospilota TaxID=206669 RepID=A0A9Q1H6F3_HOLLE|nr:hypothetical protein HOLleu_20876 [Holothuria leucospilota]